MKILHNNFKFYHATIGSCIVSIENGASAQITIVKWAIRRKVMQKVKVCAIDSLITLIKHDLFKLQIKGFSKILQIFVFILRLEKWTSQDFLTSFYAVTITVELFNLVKQSDLGEKKKKSFSDVLESIFKSS